jgi:hypothetical protein
MSLAGCISAPPPSAVSPPASGAEWAERIVRCDLHAFLRSEPNLQADRVYVLRYGRLPEILPGPWFLIGGRIYDEDLDRAERVLRSAGVLDRRAVADAQARLTRPALDAYRRSPVSWRRSAKTEEPTFRDLDALAFAVARR